jgi:hypothetical protein
MASCSVFPGQGEKYRVDEQRRPLQRRNVLLALVGRRRNIISPRVSFFFFFFELDHLVCHTWPYACDGFCAYLIRSVASSDVVNTVIRRPAV